MMIRCDICGKTVFTACADSQWPYRYKEKRFCSEDCRIVHAARDLHKVDFVNLGQQDMQGFFPCEIQVREGKTEEERDEDMRGQKMLTDEQKQKAVEIGLEGGDPIKYLKGLGAANPWGNWGYIKMKLKEKEPEKYDQLMKAQGGKQETVEKAEVKAKLTVPTKEIEEILNGGTKKALEFKVIGIETKLGKFQYDRASGQMRWMPKNSTVVIMMPAEDWEALAEQMPEIMKAIGAGGEDED